MLTPNGRLATPTVDRAGRCGKLFSNTALTSLNALKSVTNMPTLSTFSKLELAAFRIARMLSTHAVAFSVIVPSTKEPSGLPGIWPETWTRRPFAGAIVAGDWERQCQLRPKCCCGWIHPCTSHTRIAHWKAGSYIWPSNCENLLVCIPSDEDSSSYSPGNDSAVVTFSICVACILAGNRVQRICGKGKP